MKISPYHTFQGHENSVYSLDFNQESSIIISGSKDRSVAIWSIKNKSLIRRLENAH